MVNFIVAWVGFVKGMHACQVNTGIPLIKPGPV